MGKIKQLFKNKKFVITAAVLAVIIIAVILTAVFLSRAASEKRELKEETHTAYVKINPLVKLTFKVSYYEDGENSEKDVQSTEVTAFEPINDDAKRIFENSDLNGKSLTDAIVEIAKTANDAYVSVSEIRINIDWDFDIKSDIEENLRSALSGDISVTVEYKETLNEDEITENEESGKYTVTFDADGGSETLALTVNNGETVAKPADPEKEGFEFSGWQLDGQDYDFSEPVTKNITLKASWKQVSSESAPTDGNTDTENPSGANSGATAPTVSAKERDNAILKKQLEEKGLYWDFNTYEDAENEKIRWMEKGGFDGEIITSKYGESDTAYTLIITVNAAACGVNEKVNVDWRHETSDMDDFVYFLYTKGYNCSGMSGYHNGKYFVINDKNELEYQ